MTKHNIRVLVYELAKIYYQKLNGMRKEINIMIKLTSYFSKRIMLIINEEKKTKRKEPFFRIISSTDSSDHADILQPLQITIDVTKKRKEEKITLLI